MNPPGPDQPKVALGALVVEVTCTVVAVQVSGPLGVAVAVGGVVFAVTTAVALAVQPLTVLVTTTVNVPAQITAGFCWLWLLAVMQGPVHRKAACWALVVTDNTTLGLAQVMVPPVAVTVGTVVFWVTVTVALLVQPLAVEVTVTV